MSKSQSQSQGLPARSEAKPDEQRALAAAASPANVVALIEKLGAATPSPDQVDARFVDASGKDLKYARPEDLQVLPMLRLVQPTSQMAATGRARVGYWWDSEREVEIPQPILVTPLFHFMTRCRWPEIGAAETRPLCRSINMRVGAGLPGGECAKCPQAKRWLPNQTRPVGDCDVVYNFVLWPHGLGYETALLAAFARTGAGCGKNLVRLIHGARPFRAATLAVRLGAKLVQEPKPHYEPTLELFAESNSRRVCLAQLPQLAPLVARLVEQSDIIAQMHDEGRLVPSFGVEPSVDEPGADDAAGGAGADLPPAGGLADGLAEVDLDNAKEDAEKTPF